VATSKHRLEYELRLKDLASKALKKFGTNAKAASTKAQAAFKKMGGAIKMAGVALVAAFSAAAFMGLRMGIERAREFSRAMGEVNTILGEGAMTIGVASQKVNDLALSLGVPAPEVAAGMYQTLSAGVTDSVEAMTMLKAATELGIAGVASTKEAVDLLTTSFNAYGLEVTESGVASMSDMIFKTVQLGKTTIPELSASMGMVLPVASQLGVTFEEVAAAVASLTLKGLSTSEATTQLNAVFTAFLKKGELANKTFGEGSNLMGAQAIKTKGLQQAMTDLMEATGGSEDMLLKLTGRAEGAKAIMSLTADEGKILTAQLKGIGDSAGSSKEAFDKMANTMDRKLSVAMEGIKQGFGSMMGELLEAQTGATTFEDMAKQAGAFKSAIEGLAPAVNMMGLAIGLVMTGVLTIFMAVQGAIYLVAIGLEAIGAISTATFQGIEQSTAGMATALVGSAEMTDNFGRSLLGLESNGMKGTKALADLHDEMKSAPQKAYNAHIVEQGEIFDDYIWQVKKGRMEEEEALRRINMALINTTRIQREQGLTTQGLEKDWKEMVDAETLFIDEMKAAEVEAARLKAELESLGEEGKAALDGLTEAAKTFSSEFTAAFSRANEMAQIHFKLSQGLIEDDEERHIAALEFKAEQDQAAFQARLMALDVSMDEFEALELEHQELVDARLEEDIDAYKASLKEKEDELKKALSKARNIWKPFQDIVRENLIKPWRLLPALILAEKDRISAAAAEVAAAAAKAAEDARIAASKGEQQVWREGMVGKMGAPLGQAAGDELAVVAGFFDKDPVFAAKNLSDALKGAADQAAFLESMSIITPEQEADMLAMIDTVREYKLPMLEAEAANRKFAESLEGMNPVKAGIKKGFKNFTDSIPELGDAIADVTEGALASFASGMTSALMSMADGTKTAKEAWKDFARQFIADVGAMIVQMLILQAIKLAFGGAADGGVAEGGVEPVASGGVVTSGLGRAFPVRGYAAGGPIVSSPHVALIGEGSMNEAIVPLPDGRSIPVDMQGSNPDISFNISMVDARGVDELLVERQETIRNLIRQSMLENRLFRTTMQGG